MLRALSYVIADNLASVISHPCKTRLLHLQHIALQHPLMAYGMHGDSQIRVHRHGWPEVNGNSYRVSCMNLILFAFPEPIPEIVQYIRQVFVGWYLIGGIQWGHKTFESVPLNQSDRMHILCHKSGKHLSDLRSFTSRCHFGFLGGWESCSSGLANHCNSGRLCCCTSRMPLTEIVALLE